MTKEEQLRRLKEELNVTRILCCYDADDATIRTTNGGGDFASSPASSTSASFERMSLPLIDTSEEDIACVLYDAFDFMLGNERREGRNGGGGEEEEEEEEEKEEEKEGGSCLVHCQMGCSRSVAICVAFIMWKEGLSYDEAFERVKKARAISRPNIGFVKALEAWHEERTNRSSSSSSGSDVISYRIVEHENRKGYVVPKRETPSSFAAANNTPFSPKDDPSADRLAFFKSEASTTSYRRSSSATGSTATPTRAWTNARSIKSPSRFYFTNTACANTLGGNCGGAAQMSVVL